ncbi:hypothetical protein ACVWW9_000912 [Agrococcus sp. UYP33]
MDTTLRHPRTSSAAAVLTAAVLLAGCATSEAPAWTLLTTDADPSLVLEGGATLVDRVLVLDGQTGYATVAAPAELDTTAGFTVSAWVALADVQPFATAVSQRGSVAGSFYLGVAEGGFAFSMKDADTNEEGHTVRAQGAAAVADAQRWVHLAGTFNAAAGAMTLYVDGAEAATTAFDAPIRVDGDLLVGGAQANAAPADFWPGAVTVVRITPATADADAVTAEMEATRPGSAPPEAAAPDPAAYGDGLLDGTWDYVYAPEERAFLAGLLGPEAMAEIGDLTGARLGFDGPRWWQGFVGDGEVWVVDGVPEGDGGPFTIDGSRLRMGNDASGATYEWSLAGDELTLLLLDCSAAGNPCTDTDIVRFITERTWIRTSTDPSY